jgi:hypothetical protein
LQLIRAGALLFGGTGQHSTSLFDRFPVPLRSVLVLQQHEPTVGIESGGGAGAMQPDQREQARHFRLGRHQRVEQRHQPFGVVNEVSRLRPLGRRQIALVEQEVDHREDLGQAGA